MIELERKCRRREDSRRRAVEWTGGIITFVGVNGLFFIFLYRLGVFTLLTDKWGLGHTLSACNSEKGVKSTIDPWKIKKAQ